jgi:hypothetical protein
MNELTQAVDRIIAKHGGLRKAAKAINVNFAYLWRLSKGKKSNPSARILRKLGLRRRVEFHAIDK